MPKINSSSVKICESSRPRLARVSPASRPKILNCYPRLSTYHTSYIYRSITITAQYSQYYDISRYNRKALWRLQEKKIQRIAAAAVALAWQRSGGGDAATAVAAVRAAAAIARRWH